MGGWVGDQWFDDPLAERQRQNREALDNQQRAQEQAANDARVARGMHSRGGSGLLMDKGDGRLNAGVAAGGPQGTSIFGYGGKVGQADMDAAYFERQAEEADKRFAPTMNWGAFSQDINNANAMRGEETYGLGLLADAMDTSKPSLASSAILQGARDNYGAQLAAAGGARGGALGQLAARRSAELTGNTLGLQAQSQAQQLRAMEAAQARGQYGQAAGAMRSGDMAYGNAALAQQGADASNQQRQAELNAQREMAARKNAFGVRAAALEGNLAHAAYAAREKGAVLGAMTANSAQVAQAQGQAISAAAAGAAGLADIGGKVYGDMTSSSTPKKKPPTGEESY